MGLAVSHDRGIEVNGAAMWHYAHDSLDERTLATAIRPYDSEKVISIDVEVDMLEGTHRVVNNSQVAYGD
jgi:hypothetical protein